MLNSIKRWHKFAKKHFDVFNTKPDQPDWGPYFGSESIATRQTFLREIEIMDADGRPLKTQHFSSRECIYEIRERKRRVGQPSTSSRVPISYPASAISPTQPTRPGAEKFKSSSSSAPTHRSSPSSQKTTRLRVLGLPLSNNLQSTETSSQASGLSNHCHTVSCLRK